MDAVAVGEYAHKISKAEGPGDAAFTAALALCVALDMPLSFVGDTVTLPITLLASIKEEDKDKHSDETPPPTPTGSSAE